LETVTCRGGGGMLGHVIFSPDGKLLAAVEGIRQVKVWDAASGRELADFEIPRPRNPGPTSAVSSLAFDAAGRCLVAVRLANMDVELWDAATGRQIPFEGRVPGPIGAAAFGPGGKLLALGYRDGRISVHDIASGQQISSWPGVRRTVTRLAFRADGKALASVAPDIIIWDPSSGK